MINKVMSITYSVNNMMENNQVKILATVTF